MINRKILLTSLLLIFTVLSACSREKNTCRVVKISDGDTLTCLTKGNKSIKVRLAEIDAPEKSQAFGQKSKKTLSDLVYQKNVRLSLKGKDRYQRTLAIVYYQDKNINLEMVKQGMAWAYKQYSHDPIYLQAQENAQAKGIGLWADNNPIEPSQWRRQEKNQYGF
ncbi:thermonuclease family protein [Haemophilus influenzae]|uniref:thermonuclease family protein n=2 Tax=Haemophilus influenzae TaxID=727 RepID=UPI0001A66502|nr:thermonuclease family protein [Haemophilus influenzae]CVP38291.1 Thermonuclease precursor [Streptococcus pneumoniae]KIP49825.1 nuclease [Haemophilus influenzae]MBK1413474.1 thermonuclease family protein [Haemophilus influenzae]MCK8899007.1 thermonuclease family protein [Haemophilus influenzae]MCK8934668.1 thermonuclease family protein [Haemophilus influenzae]